MQHLQGVSMLQVKQCYTIRLICSICKCKLVIGTLDLFGFSHINPPNCIICVLQYSRLLDCWQFVATSLIKVKGDDDK